jgi:hypothetical protein
MLRLRTLAMFAVLALAGCTLNDAALTRRVQDRLAEDGFTDQIKVETTQRVVRLVGVVADRAALKRAEMTARYTPGITGVDDRLVVQSPVNTTGGALQKEGNTPSPSTP